MGAGIVKDYQVETHEYAGEGQPPARTRFVIDAISFVHAMEQMWEYIDRENKRRSFRPLWFTMTEKGIYDTLVDKSR